MPITILGMKYICEKKTDRTNLLLYQYNHDVCPQTNMAIYYQMCILMAANCVFYASIEGTVVGDLTRLYHLIIINSMNFNPSPQVGRKGF